MNTYLSSVLIPVLLLCTAVSAATPLEPALDESQRLAEEAKNSQQRIESMDDTTREMLSEYRNALRQTNALKAYNAQLRELVVAQKVELDGYRRQLDGIERTQEAVAPQMGKMLEVLQQFVAADLPFLPEEREDRLIRLQEMMPRADISVAEKYRRILEAYQIESDYGRTLEAWRGELPQQDGSLRSVDFLRLGRTMLYYQTLDGRDGAWWDMQSRSWQPLPGSARRPLMQAIAIARQQQAPAVLELPVITRIQESGQ